MHLLVPEEFSNLELFHERIEPNECINNARTCYVNARYLSKGGDFGSFGVVQGEAMAPDRFTSRRLRPPAGAGSPNVWRSAPVKRPCSVPHEGLVPPTSPREKLYAACRACQGGTVHEIHIGPSQLIHKSPIH